MSGRTEEEAEPTGVSDPAAALAAAAESAAQLESLVGVGWARLGGIDWPPGDSSSSSSSEEGEETEEEWPSDDERGSARAEAEAAEAEAAAEAWWCADTGGDEEGEEPSPPPPPPFPLRPRLPPFRQRIAQFGLFRPRREDAPGWGDARRALDAFEEGSDGEEAGGGGGAELGSPQLLLPAPTRHLKEKGALGASAQTQTDRVSHGSLLQGRRGVRET